MQYNNFIQSSLTLIKTSRQNILGQNITTKFAKIPHNPQNLYIELLAQKNNIIYKIQQWNFKCLKTLVQSQYESNKDSELDSIELQQKSYFSILDEKLLKFNPKLLIKTLQPSKLLMNLIVKENQLRKFQDENLILINICEYEGETFNCQISLQTIHSEMNRTQINKNMQRQIGLYSSQEQFQVLIDSQYEKQKKQKQKQRQIFEEIQKQLQAMKYLNKTNPRIQQQKIQQQDSKNKQLNLISEPINKKGIGQHKQIKSIQKLIEKKQEVRLNQQNLNISKYSTKQLILSDYQRKITLVTQTIDLIQQANIGSTNLKNFLKKLQ